MICPQDGKPMATVSGSEEGFMKPNHYVTQETKECGECGLRVISAHDPEPRRIRRIGFRSDQR